MEQKLLEYMKIEIHKSLFYMLRIFDLICNNFAHINTILYKSCKTKGMICFCATLKIELIVSKSWCTYEVRNQLIIHNQGLENDLSYKSCIIDKD